ncbi:DUF3263 domain-containing protein [Kocuria flava]|uniref:DUF3263 domain-containing protein n=1 Tax=Kocuria flava TaxID=446860 RepID=UPI003F1E3724
MSGQRPGPAGPGEAPDPHEHAGPEEPPGAAEHLAADGRPDEEQGAGGAEGLDELDRQILALENLQWKYQGAKEMEIRRRLNLSPTRYYQRLNVLLDSRAALAHDPMLVARLRRQRGDAG